MSKPLLGLIVGAVLGAIDGLSSLISAPEVAPQLMSIMINWLNDHVLYEDKNFGLYAAGKPRESLCVPCGDRHL